MKDWFTKEELISVLIITGILAVVWLIVKSVFDRFEKKFPQRRNTLEVSKKIVFYLLVFIAVANIFSVVPGVASILKSLLAGSGVAALIISIASQQAISNFVSGIIIKFSKPYKVGDLIRYTDTGTLGYVTEIKIRHTVIKTLENTQLIVPNSVINSAAIENYSYNDDRRVCQPLWVDITYESDVNKALVLMTAVIMKNKEYIDVRTEQDKAEGKPPVVVRFRKFSDSSLTLEAWVWAKNYVTWLNLRSELNKEIKRIFDANGIEFAYPHMQVITDVPKEETKKNPNCR